MIYVITEQKTFAHSPTAYGTHTVSARVVGAEAESDSGYKGTEEQVGYRIHWVVFFCSYKLTVLMFRLEGERTRLLGCLRQVCFCFLYTMFHRDN